MIRLVSIEIVSFFSGNRKYFHNTEIHELIQTDRSGYVYKGVPCAHVPTPHSDTLPVPVHPSKYQYDTATYDAQSQTATTPSPLADSDYIPPVGQELPSLISQDHNW